MQATNLAPVAQTPAEVVAASLAWSRGRSVTWGQFALAVRNGPPVRRLPLTPHRSEASSNGRGPRIFEYRPMRRALRGQVVDLKSPAAASAAGPPPRAAMSHTTDIRPCRIARAPVATRNLNLDPQDHVNPTLDFAT